MPCCNCCCSTPCSLCHLLSLGYNIAGPSNSTLYLRTYREHVQPLKVTICSKLIAMLIKYELNDVELELVTLPARMFLDDPVVDLHCKTASSFECTTHFTALIIQGESELPRVNPDRDARRAVSSHHQIALKAEAGTIRACLHEPQQRTMELVWGKGESCTLTTPITEHGFFF